MRGGVSCRWRVLAALAGTLVSLCGCGFLEHTLSPRTYAVNESADSVLNNAVLLNILRAGNSEPLNFVAITKYTAGNQLAANAAIGPFTYAVGDLNPARTYGPGSLNGQASGSFDLNVLENRDFYQGLLQNLDPIALELWFRQGLPRALVFYVLLDSIRLSASDGVYEYKNDPEDDRWTDEITRTVESVSEQCRPRPTGRGSQTNYDVDSRMWHGVHGNDCGFHKFQYLVSLAVRYGLRLETIEIPIARSATHSRGPAALHTPSAVQATTPAAPATADAPPKKKTQVCYDPAVLRQVAPAKFRPLFTQCGKNRPSGGNAITLGGIGTFRDTEFVMRSLFGIFQYLGRVLSVSSPNGVVLSPRQFDVPHRDDDKLLTVVEGIRPDCFALAWYRATPYCVPNEGATNTKLIFTMLRAMLATNISAALLNSTPTIRVTP